MTTSIQTFCTFLLLVLLTLSWEISLTKGQCNPVLKDDGTIDWDSCTLPSHTEANFEDADKYVEDIPDGLVDMATGFIDFVQPNAFPYERIREIIEDSPEYDDASIKEVALFYIGILICFIIGILFIIVMPIVGLCFCCCRCCNNCGGKRIQKETKAMGCKHVVFSVLLLSITIVIGFGMAYSNTANDFLTTTSWQRTKATYNLSLKEIELYSNSITKQLDYMLLEFQAFDGKMRSEIDDRGNQIYTLSEPYFEDECGVNELYKSYENFTNALNASLTTLKVMDELQKEIINNINTLEEDLNSSKSDLDSAITACGAPCNGIDTSNLALQTNIKLPDLTNEIGNVTKVLENAEEFEEEAKGTIDSIPDEINNSTQEDVNKFYEELDEINESLENGIDDVKEINDDVIEFVKEHRIPQKKNASSDEISIEEMDEYVDYVKYGFIGITCTILLIVMFSIGGMAMGTFTYKQGSPLDRSRCSNAGGNVLMCGVFLSFLFFWILMFIVSVFFLIFSISYQFCDPLQTKDLFRNTIDYPGFLVDGDTGSFIGQELYSNSSYNVSITYLLESCEKNASLYQALQLHYKFDLDDVQNGLDELEKEVNELIDNVEWDTNDFELVTDELVDAVNEVINDSRLTEFNITEYEEMLNQNLTTDLYTFAEELNEIAANVSDESVQNSLQDIADQVIEADQLAKETQEKMSELLAEAEKLQEEIIVIKKSGNETLKAANYTETQIKAPETQEEIKNSTKIYADKLIGYTNSYANHLTDEVENDFAKCATVSSLYNMFLDTLCDFNIDALNTIWFTLGWSIFFFIPSIIFSVKLAKYYRIMDEEYIAVPKKKKKKNKHNGDIETPEEDEMGADSMQLMENSRRGATNKDVTPYANPHYRHDSPILGYNDLDDRGVAPPAYNYGARRPVSAMYPSHGPQAPRPQPKPKRYSDMYEYNYQTEEYM